MHIRRPSAAIQVPGEGKERIMGAFAWLQFGKKYQCSCRKYFQECIAAKTVIQNDIKELRWISKCDGKQKDQYISGDAFERSSKGKVSKRTEGNQKKA